MVALPVVVSLVISIAICPALVRSLRRREWTGPNYRGARVAHPAGVALVVSATASLGALAGLDAVTGADPLPPGLFGLTAFVAGVALLGLVDDLIGDSAGGGPRGLRAHARAVARGRPTTGAVKALGTAGLSVAVLAGRGLDSAELVLAASVLTLSVHVFNLLDLRPGRSIKVLLVLGAGLTVGSGAFGALGALAPFLAPIVVLLAFDLRERAMLGDTGAGAVGAVGGLWIVLTLPAVGQAVALALLLATAAYGELRSISALVERTPLLRRIDSLGRCW